jgi:signal transduction histidine kinase
VSEYRTWPVFLLGFASITALTGVVGVSVFRVGERAHAEVSQIHEAHRQRANALSHVQGLVWQSAILLRDLAMATGSLPDPQYEREFSRIRAAVEKALEGLDVHFGPDPPVLFERLRNELVEYWKSQEGAFYGLSDAASVLAPAYLRREVVPRRFAVLRLAEEIDRLNRENLREEESRTAASAERSRAVLGRVFAGGVLAALVVAGLATVRLSRLEREWREERDRAEGAGEALRRLSQELVRAQEEERRNISRELHDEIGQTLTALRLEVGRLERIRTGPQEEFQGHAEEARALVETSLRAVRDLAMGLRPSMLDDFGLEPALGWQAREFSRRTGVSVAVECGQDLGTLPDAARTCLYRVAQEALTNCARHAKAKQVRIAVRQDRDGVELTVEDDGIGFDPKEARGRGLGLLGIEERVSELGGTVRLASRLYQGTRLDVRLPAPRGEGTA